jgi:hypothetical protein
MEVSDQIHISTLLPCKSSIIYPMNRTIKGRFVHFRRIDESFDSEGNRARIFRSSNHNLINITTEITGPYPAGKTSLSVLYEKGQSPATFTSSRSKQKMSLKCWYVCAMLHIAASGIDVISVFDTRNCKRHSKQCAFTTQSRAQLLTTV